MNTIFDEFPAETREALITGYTASDNNRVLIYNDNGVPTYPYIQDILDKETQGSVYGLKVTVIIDGLNLRKAINKVKQVNDFELKAKKLEEAINAYNAFAEILTEKYGEIAFTVPTPLSPDTKIKLGLISYHPTVIGIFTWKRQHLQTVRQSHAT